MHLFHLGPLITGEGDCYVVVTMDDDGFAHPSFGQTLEEALREAVQGLASKPALVTPALALLAKRHGLTSAPLPREFIEARALLALSMANDASFREHPPEAVTAFAQAAKAFYDAEPWLVWEAEELLHARVTGALEHVYEGVIMGGAGREFGLALYDKPGAIERLHSGPKAAMREDALSVTTGDPDTDFALEPMRDAFGLSHVPLVMRLKRSRLGAASTTELLMLALTLRAASKLAPDHLSAREALELTIDDEPIKLEVSVTIAPPSPGQSTRASTKDEPQLRLVKRLVFEPEDRAELKVRLAKIAVERASEPDHFDFVAGERPLGSAVLGAEELEVEALSEADTVELGRRLEGLSDLTEEDVSAGELLDQLQELLEELDPPTAKTKGKTKAKPKSKPKAQKAAKGAKKPLAPKKGPAAKKPKKPSSSKK